MSRRRRCNSHDLEEGVCEMHESWVLLWFEHSVGVFWRRYHGSALCYWEFEELVAY